MFPLPSHNLDDMGDVQSKLVLSIITSHPGLTEGEGGNVIRMDRAAVLRTTGQGGTDGNVHKQQHYLTLH